MNKVKNIAGKYARGLTRIVSSARSSTKEETKHSHSHPTHKSVHHGGKKKSAFSINIFSPRFSLKELTFFAKRLSFLINAGVPVLDALHVLRDQTLSRGHKTILDRIIEDASNGQALSKSFAKFPKIFSDFAIHIIKVGESSGTLSQNLQYLSDELKKRHALRRKVVGALVYPAFITVATVGITGLLTVFIFPKILPIFSSLNVTLPLSTRMVIVISVFLSHWGLWLILGIIIAGGAFLFILKKSEFIHFYFDRVILRLPLIGKMIRYYNVANASRTLGLLLKSGSKLSEALLITADTTPNLVYKREFAKLAQAVDRGERISTHLKKQRHYFPDILGQMVAVGEKSGSLSETLVYLSELYEAEVEDFTKNLSSMIEPVLMIVMGVMVGFIAISVITPIYGITQHLSPR